MLLRLFLENRQFLDGQSIGVHDELVRVEWGHDGLVHDDLARVAEPTRNAELAHDAERALAGCRSGLHSNDFLVYRVVLQKCH